MHPFRKLHKSGAHTATEAEPLEHQALEFVNAIPIEWRLVSAQGAAITDATLYFSFPKSCHQS
jgi:hypothetical protein